MQPHIDVVRFGTVVVDGARYRHDIVISPSGQVKRRSKELSKQRYGTSHTISVAEVEVVWQPGVRQLIVGAGFLGRVRLSPEAEAYLSERECASTIVPVRRAARLWNEAKGGTAGLFHITC
ncbi:MAG: hypothetical protein JXA09_00905 [Anaerolineae bacterium]|nr:hypothetical protein [Anaerolineae bacterium]